jgi:hypothetical protein
MLYVLFKNNEPVHVTDESPYTGTPELKKFDGVDYDSVKDSWDYKSFEEVRVLAEKLSAFTGDNYLPYEDTGTSPTFGVFVPPQLGDEVSYGFNGDTYPCGKITRITPSLRLTAVDENGRVMKFNRRKNTPYWCTVGGTWHLVKGHVSTQNPHF